MKTIVFSYSLAKCDLPARYIDLSGKENHKDFGVGNIGKKVELSSILTESGRKWFDEFSSWLSKLNRHNADLFWWAHTSTAKNLLSSPLGERFIQIHAICEIVKKEDASTLSVVGATPGQMEAIASLLSPSEFRFTGKAWHWRRWNRSVNNVNALVRQLIQCTRAFGGFCRYQRPNAAQYPDLCLFTYLDNVHRAGIDNYFGELPQILYGDKKASASLYLAYVYTPYRKRLQQLLKVEEHDSVPYVALFGLLHNSDFHWALLNSLREWWRHSCFTDPTYRDIDEYTSLLHEIFIHDLAVGEYLHNLLVYKAIRRFLKDYTPKVLIYPFENKSIEKMILLGISDASNKPKTIGYQHTSITPRHSTFLFKPGEAGHTPLPDKIITVGKVTRNYLEILGNYPPGIFVTGCAFRQVWGDKLPRQRAANMRVLVALSSSKKELVQSVVFFKRVMQHWPDLELGIRPHINFPLSLLPKDLATWVDENNFDLSNTLLQDNLAWCSITAYVSSTIALETLARGKPIVNFSIENVISSDPVISEAPFHWHVNNELEMVDILTRVHDISENEYQDISDRAITYARDYLAPVDNLCLQRLAEQLTNTKL